MIDEKLKAERANESKKRIHVVIPTSAVDRLRMIGCGSVTNGVLMASFATSPKAAAEIVEARNEYYSPTLVHLPGQSGRPTAASQGKMTAAERTAWNDPQARYARAEETFLAHEYVWKGYFTTDQHNKWMREIVEGVDPKSLREQAERETESGTGVPETYEGVYEEYTTDEPEQEPQEPTYFCSVCGEQQTPPNYDCPHNHGAMPR